MSNLQPAESPEVVTVIPANETMLQITLLWLQKLELMSEEERGACLKVVQFFYTPMMMVKK